MSIIHRTTLTPTKLELLTTWLPTCSWYSGGPGAPVLSRAGGFRLDDPHGEVGMEFMVVLDGSGDLPVAYQVPLTYRGAPLDGAEAALVGTSEHGVLGKRWIYDGTRDPVLLDRTRELLRGLAEPQMQSVSDTPDPSVAVRAPAGDAAVDGLAPHFVRVLDPAAPAPAGAAAQVVAGWRTAQGEEARAVFAALLPAHR
ncbi:maltokinase N-terminal cap-like domain-containing protein [Streptomyces sp. MS06]|uniref:maltokinase N-terminal cap-like domain-containing protein n=1 Tax=Streptomyces sp. MS06 TaxID=3385974 RepID=UPI0039A1E640